MRILAMSATRGAYNKECDADMKSDRHGLKNVGTGAGAVLQ